MTEAQLEREYEAMTNVLDYRFMHSDMTQSEYDAECARRARWIKVQLQQSPSRRVSFSYWEG